MRTTLRSILTPALTAVTENFQIDGERTIEHFAWLLENGSDGLLVKIRQAFSSYPLIPALKAVISRMRGEEGWKNVRPPLLPLSELEIEGLFEKLSAVDFGWPVSSRNATL